MKKITILLLVIVACSNISLGQNNADLQSFSKRFDPEGEKLILIGAEGHLNQFPRNKSYDLENPLERTILATQQIISQSDFAEKIAQKTPNKVVALSNFSLNQSLADLQSFSKRFDPEGEKLVQIGAGGPPALFSKSKEYYLENPFPIKSLKIQPKIGCEIYQSIPKTPPPSAIKMAIDAAEEAEIIAQKTPNKVDDVVLPIIAFVVVLGVYSLVTQQVA
jgi:hypothetical protein